MSCVVCFLFLRDEPTPLRETCRPSRNNEGFARERFFLRPAAVRRKRDLKHTRV